MLVKNVELDGRKVDLRLTDRIDEIGQALSPGDEVVLDVAGCAVLPGLHDHHIHLFATASAAASVGCTKLGVDDMSRLKILIREAPGADWIRAVGYHESMAGPLDRYALDQICPERPLRLQHSSGKLWIVNSIAIERLRLKSVQHQSGVERDAAGRLTGRLFRMDGWLQRTLAEVSPPNLSVISAELAGYGVTSVTEASYTNTARVLEHYASARARGELLQRLYVMGDESLATGPLKIMLDEDDLPDLSRLVYRVRHAHDADRGAAIHCVSHVELLVALAALAEAGPHPADRIEHAGVVRRDVLPQLVNTGATVVTQPGFIADRGERFRRAADVADVAGLYRYASLQLAGVPVAASSDAPYGPINPWRIMSAAVTRRTEIGQVLIESECVSAAEALRGYLSTSQQPGGAARKLEVGAPADLCILAGRLDDRLNKLPEVKVEHTICSGRLVYSSDVDTSSYR